MNLKSITKSALNAVFNLGPDLIKDATYVRPVSFSSSTGLTATAEVTASVKMLIATFRQPELGFTLLQPETEKILIRASELALIASPAPGDYLIQTSDSQRREILAAALDRTSEFWTFHTVRSLHQDWGDLTSHTTSEDFGDLTGTTALEDFGTLSPM
ncbi:MAG: hypothetical protein L0Y58_01415 [Verrucomicrobia subdivision 3 bacterium]|nr:hypothetical protein [Limisphaerales bacterium]